MRECAGHCEEFGKRCCAIRWPWRTRPSQTLSVTTLQSISADHHDHLVLVADEIAEMVLACTLPKPRWTHEAHLLTCASLVRRQRPVGALRVLRQAIPRYNEATGVANTPTGGYHDTLTVFYVWAVNGLLTQGCTITQVLHDPSVDRHAALRWWDRDTLFSVDAREHWVAPTLAVETDVGPAEPE